MLEYFYNFIEKMQWSRNCSKKENQKFYSEFIEISWELIIIVMEKVWLNIGEKLKLSDINNESFDKKHDH